mgnify:CR=1 FL=1
MNVYSIIFSFLEHVRTLGWEVKSLLDYGQYLDLTNEIVAIPGEERACIQYREWRKTINPGTVLRDFYLLREGITRGLYDYIILIYSPGHNTPISFYSARPRHLDKLVIFDLNLGFKKYSTRVYTGRYECKVAKEFEEYIRQLGFRPW